MWSLLTLGCPGFLTKPERTVWNPRSTSPQTWAACSLVQTQLGVLAVFLWRPELDSLGFPEVLASFVGGWGDAFALGVCGSLSISLIVLLFWMDLVLQLTQRVSQA